MYSPKATTHPSIPNGAWTKVNTLSGEARKSIMLINEDSSNAFRFETGSFGASIPTLSTEGMPLAVGAVYEETEADRTSGDVWVYQASGGALTTLAVKEAG